MLDHPRLRVAAIQDGDLGTRRAAGDALADFFDDPAGLLPVGGGRVDAHRLAVAGVGAQVLAQAAGVVGNQVVGRVQDVAVRTVVLLQLDAVRDTEFALEVHHVADVGAAEGVDALVVVAHGEDGVGRDARLAQAGQDLQPGVLQAVGVLELVDQDVLEAPLVVRADRIVVTQQLIAAQQQL